MQRCETGPVMLRPALPADDPRILGWNEQDVQFLAPMDPERLGYLKERAHAVEVIHIGPTTVGFVVTFVEGADYDSPNYRWFAGREEEFHYVDRIVVDPQYRGQGLAGRVYAMLADRFPTRPMCAEVNFAPPNPASLAFHQRLGFTEVGRLGAQPNGVVLLVRPPQRPCGV